MPLGKLLAKGLKHVIGSTPQAVPKGGRGKIRPEAQTARDNFNRAAELRQELLTAEKKVTRYSSDSKLNAAVKLRKRIKEIQAELNSIAPVKKAERVKSKSTVDVLNTGLNKGPMATKVK